MKGFLKVYFSMIVLIIIISHFVLANSNIDLNNIEFATNNNYHSNPDSKLNWPLFGYYTISSYFGKRISPTTRSFFISYWN